MPRRRFTERYGLPAPAVQAPVLPDLSRQNAVNARLGQFPLEQEARQAQIDRATASEAKARYDLTKQIETDRQRTAFYNGLQELEQNLTRSGYGIGTREHAEAFASYAHEFPLARSSTDVNQTLKLHAIVNDDQAALKQRMLQLSPPPEKIAQRYAKVQGDIATFSSDPSKASDLNGALVESDQIERAYPQLKVPSLPTQVITPTEDGTPTTPNAQPNEVPSDMSDAVATASATPHPLEGQTVRNKQTGAMGVITNGQFIPNDVPTTQVIEPPEEQQ